MSDMARRGSSIRQLNWRATLDVMASIVMMITAAVVVWSVVSRPTSAPPPVSVPTTPLAIDPAPTLGSPSASVAMLIFSDFECPYCARFAAEVMRPLERQYGDTGLVRFVFRYFPLPIHRRAARAAESAECAARQGRFWAMHDALFQPPVRLSEPELETHARDAGLDLAAFAGCMTGTAVARVAADSAMARELGLTVTPSVIVGVVGGRGTVSATEVIVGVRPLEDFGKALDRALAKARKL